MDGVRKEGCGTGSLWPVSLLMSRLAESLVLSGDLGFGRNLWLLKSLRLCHMLGMSQSLFDHDISLKSIGNMPMLTTSFFRFHTVQNLTSEISIASLIKGMANHSCGIL